MFSSLPAKSIRVAWVAALLLLMTAVSVAGATDVVGQLARTNPPVNSMPPSITGTATDGQTLTALNGTWSPTGGTFTYQWQRSATTSNFTSIANATSSTYLLTQPDVGMHVRVVVTDANEAGSSSASSTQTASVSETTPVNSAVPSISGTPVDGTTLTVSNGTWSPVGAVTYQWLRNTGDGWSAITGATASTYTLTDPDLGATIEATVTETNSSGHNAATAAAVGPVTPAPPANASAPSISGTTVAGNTLTAATGAWSPSGTVSYQWQRNAGSGFAAITGATSGTYVLTSADVDATVEVIVTESNGGGSTSATSAPVGPVIAPAQTTTTTTTTTPATTTTPQTLAPAPQVLATPALTAGAFLTAGGTVTVVAGRYSGGSAKVQIYLCRRTCAPAAAVGVTRLKLTPADAGDYLIARVTVTGSGASVSRWGAAIGPVRGRNVAVGPVPAKAGVLRDGAGHTLVTVTRRKVPGKVSVTITLRPGAPASTVRLCSIVGGSAVQCSSAVTPARVARRLTLAAQTGAKVQLVAVTKSARG